MALPTPPIYTNAIPNNPFYSPASYLLQGATSPYTVGAGLNVSASGVISSSGGGGGITAVNGSSPISVTTLAGVATVSIDAASTSQPGAVQLSDSTSDTSTTDAATANAVKTAFDLASDAIPKACLTNKGALVTATGTAIPAPLSVGTDGQVLTACAACIEGIYWSTAAGATPTALGGLYGCTNDSTAGDNQYNVALGFNANGTITTGCYNVAIGGASGDITSGNNNVAIGYDTNVANPASDCQLAIGPNALVRWLTGDSTMAIKPGAGIIDCASSCGTANMVLTSQGNAIQWKAASAVAPAPDFGSFYSTSNQINSGSINVVQLNSTQNANNFSLNLGQQIVAGNTGFYNLQFSAQMTSVSASPASVYFWIRKNGVDVPNSNRVFLSYGTSQYVVAGFNYIVEATTAGDYFEIVWESPDFNVTLVSFAPSGAPNVRSAVATIVPVGA